MLGNFKWLKAKFCQQTTNLDASAPQLSGLVQSFEQGQDVPMPDIYGRDDAAKRQNIGDLDDSSSDDNESTKSGESAGSNPYNTS